MDRKSCQATLDILRRLTIPQSEDERGQHSSEAIVLEDIVFWRADNNDECVSDRDS